jgi:light-regulated signal transduction histidine kinase (bacteriophytochrome)
VGEDGKPLAEDDRPLRVTTATGRPQVAVPLGLSRTDGSMRWLSVSTRAVEPDREGPHTVVVSFSDVTEERDAARALERSNAELQQFAYVASHDLSEPLRMVSSYLGLLRRRYHGRLDPDADEFIGYAVDGAGRMRGLIEALLAYSRAGSTDDEPERVELGSVAADVLRSLAAALVEAGADIEISDLPVVMGDRAQLEQLLQNLVANALKFRDGGRARVWVRTEETAGGMTQIAVADGGIGIAADQRERVFEMFGRLHDRETYEGTGIGLAICRKIVERHGGRIWIDEREGGGTVFRFTLPVA